MFCAVWFVQFHPVHNKLQLALCLIIYNKEISEKGKKYIKISNGLALYVGLVNDGMTQLWSLGVKEIANKIAAFTSSTSCLCTL